MTTEATLACTCVGVCGGHFRFVGDRGEATEKLPFDAGEGMMQVRMPSLKHIGGPYTRCSYDWSWDGVNRKL